MIQLAGPDSTLSPSSKLSPTHMDRPNSRGICDRAGSRRGPERERERGRLGERGFTLIELLVVMSIIVVLGGLSVVGLRVAQQSSRVSAEQHTISLFRTAIATFGQEWGDFPPTSLRNFKVRKTNPVNEGNEALCACLQARKHNGPFLPDLDESRWENYDDDRLTPADSKEVKKRLDWIRSGNQLLEYTDYWGNPYVYIHNVDYGKELTYQGVDGNKFTVRASKNSKTEGYSAPSSYQLWSLGPNGINENGEGDDICSWKS